MKCKTDLVVLATFQVFSRNKLSWGVPQGIVQVQNLSTTVPFSWMMLG